MSSDELLTAKEAAAVLKLSLPAFYAWRRRHAVPNQIESRSLRFLRSDLVRGSKPAGPARVLDYAELGRLHARGELRRSANGEFRGA